MSTVALLLAAVVAVTMPPFSRFQVTVDGVERTADTRMTAGQVLESGWVHSSAGDLVDREGLVVERGRGEAPHLLRGGRALAPDTLLVAGDVVISARGSDIAESEITTRMPVPIDVTYSGTGPLFALESPGAVGVREQVIGEISGRVFVDEVIEESQPMVVRRYAPNGQHKVVALTFDDGPWPGHTNEVLNILEAEGVRATFFVIGRQVRRYPGVVLRARDDGHAIGNHTEAHPMLDRVDDTEVARQIAVGQASISGVTGVAPRWFRPPGGRMTAQVGAESARHGMRVAMWTVDPQDWRKAPADEMAADVLANVKPGAVV
ncbi:MAG: polysaccharide deacetylase family protein, partial [Actinomycetota bacterium]|nr:polysaccharide deacetylase family protein [Actinomycetota bacterium]